MTNKIEVSKASIIAATIVIIFTSLMTPNMWGGSFVTERKKSS
jgi:hypothetical protein